MEDLNTEIHPPESRNSSAEVPMSLTALEENPGAPELSEGHPPGSPRFRKLESALKQDFWIVSGILALTFLLYLGSLPKQFTNWDDAEYIVNNPLIRSFSLQNLNKIITEPYFA